MDTRVLLDPGDASVLPLEAVFGGPSGASSRRCFPSSTTAGFGFVAAPPNDSHRQEADAESLFRNDAVAPSKGERGDVGDEGTTGLVGPLVLCERGV